MRFLEGWFADTLPHAPIERLAVLRMDGDMYGSTMEVLEALYGKLSVGGFVIVDDYFLPACAKAVNDFRERCGITSPILPIDGWGTYWRVDHAPIRLGVDPGGSASVESAAKTIRGTARSMGISVSR